MVSDRVSLIARYMKTKYRLGGARVMLLPAAYVFRGLNGVLKILRGRK